MLKSIDLNDILLRFDSEKIKNALAELSKKNDVSELIELFDQIDVRFFSFIKSHRELVGIISRYVRSNDPRLTEIEDFINKLIQHIEKSYNKFTIASKHRDTRVRRISLKNKILRFLKNNYDQLLKFIGMYVMILQSKFEKIDEQRSVISFKNSLNVKKSNISPDILSVSGAGQDGTDILVKNYKKDTPGQLTEDAECHLFSFNEIKDLEKFADRLLNKFGVDIQFTKHFAERMSSDRNHPCIKLAELQSLFKRIEANKAEKIKKHPNGEFVIVDAQKDLNLPVVITYKNGEFDVVAKTIMRKKNFLTTSPKIRVESFTYRNKL